MSFKLLILPARRAKSRSRHANIITSPSVRDISYYLKLTAYANGDFDIFNAGTGKTAHYPLRM